MTNVRVLINPEDRIGHINPEIYGHFAEHLGRCIYGGIFVGEDSPIPNTDGIRNDVLDALRDIKTPVVRWPGGCFAEEYHWKNGIGPKAGREKTVNTNWGGVTEDNSFGTHEYMNFCRLVGCEPFITGNAGSGTVQEMAEWVEYLTSDGCSAMTELRRQNGRELPWKLKYLGIGNENWGCGGFMKAESYADVYRRYQSFCKSYGESRLYKIACGPSSADYDWMEKLMRNLDPDIVNGVDLHYYTMPIWPETDSATVFDDDLYYATVRSADFADELLTRHTEIMNRYDPENRIGLIIGEWGCWHETEPGTNPCFLYQQNTMRDAIAAAIELNTFNRHSKRVVMANLAQTVNVLQSVLLTDGEKMVKTPTYHVFDLFKNHQNGDAVYCFHDAGTLPKVGAPMLSVSASVKDGAVTLTAANCSLTETAELEISLYGRTPAGAAGRILCGEARAYNDFDKPEQVKLRAQSVTVDRGTVRVTLPPVSVAEIRIE